MGNSPVWYGEWALSTQFNATDEFLFKWADAQKLVYSQDAGWLVCPSAPDPFPLMYLRIELPHIVLELQNREDKSSRTSMVRFTMIY